MSETTSSGGPEYARIVATDDTLGGKPRIDGRRIGVFTIHEWVEGRGLDPQTVADRHDLDVADVYRALAYYHDHPGEMAAIRERRERLREEAEQADHVATGPSDL
ncbi:MAG: DUF433 domain-containing protein [Halobaculum sp.]